MARRRCAKRSTQRGQHDERRREPDRRGGAARRRPARLPAQARAALAPLFRRHHCAKSEGLLAQGQLWRDALLIEHGLLRLYFVRRDCALFTLLWIAVRLHRLERGARMTVQGEAGAGAAL